MKRIVVTYNFQYRLKDGSPSGMQCGMDIFKMEGLARVDQWNKLMENITDTHPEIIPNTICVLYTKELLNT